MQQQVSNRSVTFLVRVIVFDVFAHEISQLDGIAAEKIHDVETGGHNFGDGGDIVFSVVIDGKLP